MVQNSALVGYGDWGKIVMRYIVPENGFLLKKIFSRTYNENEMFTTSLENIANDSEISVVFLTTPIETHVELIEYFMRHGKHVFCEKPLSCDYKKTCELVDYAEKVGKVLFVDYTFCYSPSILKIRELISLLGEIRHVDAEFLQFGKFYNNNVLSVIGIHWIAVIKMLFKKQIKVKDIKADYYIKGHPNYICAEYETDTYTINLRANLLSANKYRRIIIYGNNGTLVYDTSASNTISLIQFDNNVKKKELYFNFDENNNLRNSVRYFKNIIDGESNLVDIKDTEHLLYDSISFLGGEW